MNSIVILVCFCVNIGDSAQILGYFPTPSISHQVVFRPLMQELARRGHDVTVVTPDPAFERDKRPSNLTEIDLHDISYDIWKKEVVKHIDGNSEDNINLIKIIIEVNAIVFEKQIQSQEVQRLIMNNDKFDLVFTEACARITLIIGHIFKAPIIQLSSFMAVPPNYQFVGSLGHPIFFPELTRKRLYNFSLVEKIKGIIEEIKIIKVIYGNEKLENEIIQRNFGHNAPSIEELNKKVEMLFLNVHPLWEDNRPVPPAVIRLGGLHIKPTKELPSDLKYFLDSSKNGVIYMSFGSNVVPSQLPREKIQIFCKVFSELSYDILWKYDKDILEGKPKNVRLSKWLPQNDLLRHPKLRLFITQAGLQSTDEAISAGVPLIAFPIIGDQWFNAEKYVKHEIGLKLDLETVTEDILRDSIQTVITEERYRKNIQKLREVMRDEPQTPLERAVWWTEHIIRHGGGGHLRAATANTSWSEFLILDVVIVVLAGSVIVFGFLIYLSLWIIRKFKNVFAKQLKFKQS